MKDEHSAPAELKARTYACQAIAFGVVTIDNQDLPLSTMISLVPGVVYTAAVYMELAQQVAGEIRQFFDLATRLGNAYASMGALLVEATFKPDDYPQLLRNVSKGNIVCDPQGPDYSHGMLIFNQRYVGQGTPPSWVNPLSGKWHDTLRDACREAARTEAKLGLSRLGLGWVDSPTE